jgi:DNA-binding transcriptional MocR family regulator
MTINFFKGHPTERLTARLEILDGAKKVLIPEYRDGDNDDEIRHPLIYGTDPGALNVRQAISGWSLKAHGETDYGAIDPDSINLTNGASYGAQTVLQQCTAAQRGYTKQAFIVSPTYFLINSVFEDAGFHGRMTSIEETEEKGIDLDYLQKQLEYYDSLPDESGGLDGVDDMLGKQDPPRKIYRYVMYIVPTFSNPRGSTMPLAARQRLITLARKHDMLLLCDDVYDLLDYRPPGSPRLPRLVTLDRTSNPTKHGNSVSNCTFSKLIGPGFRVGWQETTSPHLAQQFARGGAIKSGGTPANLNTFIVREMILDGKVDEVISKLKQEFGQRSTEFIKHMKTSLPEGTTIQGGDGGYFFWVTLPNQYSTDKITKRAEEIGLILAPEEAFKVSDGKPLKPNRSSFRVSLSYTELPDIAKGVGLWAQACKDSLT